VNPVFAAECRYCAFPIPGTTFHEASCLLFLRPTVQNSKRMWLPLAPRLVYHI